MIFNRYLVCLITTSPYHQLGVLKMDSLLLWSRGFHKLDSLLLTLDHLPVEPLGITSESRVRIDEAVLVGKNLFAEFRVAVVFGLSHSSIENFDLVSVEYLDASIFKVLW